MSNAHLFPESEREVIEKKMNLFVLFYFSLSNKIMFMFLWMVWCLHFSKITYSWFIFEDRNETIWKYKNGNDSSSRCSETYLSFYNSLLLELNTFCCFLYSCSLYSTFFSSFSLMLLVLSSCSSSRLSCLWTIFCNLYIILVNNKMTVLFISKSFRPALETNCLFPLSW